MRITVKAIDGLKPIKSLFDQSVLSDLFLTNCLFTHKCDSATYNIFYVFNNFRITETVSNHKT